MGYTLPPIKGNKNKSKFDKWLDKRTVPEMLGMIVLNVGIIIFLIVGIVGLIGGIINETKRLFQTEQIEEVVSEQQPPIWR